MSSTPPRTRTAPTHISTMLASAHVPRGRRRHAACAPRPIAPLIAHKRMVRPPTKENSLRRWVRTADPGRAEPIRPMMVRPAAPTHLSSVVLEAQSEFLVPHLWPSSFPECSQREQHATTRRHERASAEHDGDGTHACRDADRDQVRAGQPDPVRRKNNIHKEPHARPDRAGNRPERHEAGCRPDLDDTERRALLPASRRRAPWATSFHSLHHPTSRTARTSGRGQGANDPARRSRRQARRACSGTPFGRRSGGPGRGRQSRREGVCSG